MLTIVRRFGEFGGDIFSELRRELPSSMMEMLAYLNMKLGMIEVVHGKQQLSVYFSLLPLYDFVSKLAKDKLMKEVSRNTQREKLVDLLERKERFFDEMKHNFHLRYSPIPATGRNIQKLQSLIGKVSFALNLLLLLFTHVQVETSRGLVVHFPFKIAEEILHLASLVFLALVILLIVGTALNQVPRKIAGRKQQ